MSTKDKWIYIYKDVNINLDSIEPKLPKQAMVIAKLLKETDFNASQIFKHKNRTLFLSLFPGRISGYY